MKEHLEALIGQEVCVWCRIYIYHGTLTKVGESSIVLSNPYIVYGTGVLKNEIYEDAEKINVDENIISLSSIESAYKSVQVPKDTLKRSNKYNAGVSSREGERKALTTLMELQNKRKDK